MSSVLSMFVLSFNYLTQILAASLNTTKLVWDSTNFFHKNLFILGSGFPYLCLLSWEMVFSYFFKRDAKLIFISSLYTFLSLPNIEAISCFAFSSFNKKISCLFSVRYSFSLIGCAASWSLSRNRRRETGFKSLVILIMASLPCLSFSL